MNGNTADTLAYNAEKTLREQGEKIPADLRVEVEGEVAQVRSALQSGDINQIRRKVDEPQASLQKIGAAVYGQTRGGQQGDESPDGTVKGEFREV